MAKLLIFRGETLHAERALTGQTLRIGRSAENDVVLEDPSKGVSRTHAELRFEGGRYVLVDRESQNGIWVAGARVPTVTLDRDVVATLGPYRLKVEGAGADTAVLPETGEFTPISEPSKAEPLVLDSLAPLPSDPTPPPHPRAHDRPPAAKRQPPPAAPPSSGSRMWVVAAAVVLLLGISGVVIYKMMNRPLGSVWEASLAEAMVNSGSCQDALERHINPELARNPGNADAIRLRDRCQTVPAPTTTTTTTTSVPVPTVEERLTQAEAQIAAKDCQTAFDAITQVLTEEPANARATDLLAKAKACGTPTTTTVPNTPGLAVKVPPSKGGLDPRPNETDKDYQARIQAMRKRYEEGVALLQRRSYQAAARVFGEIDPQVPSGYLELAQLRAEALGALREEAKNSLDAAQAAESKNDFDAAVEAYRRAHALDRSIEVDAAIQRINDRKLELGRRRCTEGNAQYTYSNRQQSAAQQAIAAYRDVLKLLPESEPCYATAQERLKLLIPK